MRITKNIFSLFLGVALLVTSISRGFAMNHNNHNEEAIQTENSCKKTFTIAEKNINENKSKNEDSIVADGENNSYDKKESDVEESLNEQDKEMVGKEAFSTDEDINEDEVTTSVKEESSGQNEDDEMSGEESINVNEVNGVKHYQKKVSVTVIAYSKEIRDCVCNSISSGRNSIIGQSPVDNKYYKIKFVKLPPYTAYCDDNKLRRYISDNESKITKCCGCMFIYDLSKVYDSYDGPLLESWKMRENGYGNRVKEECRRWCHAIERINPERFFLFMPDKRNLHNSEDKDFWGEYACDQIGSYCEHLWLTRYPSHGQFVSSITIPRNDYNIIPEHLLQIIPNHNHIRNLLNYYGASALLYILKKYSPS